MVISPYRIFYTLWIVCSLQAWSFGASAEQAKPCENLGHLLGVPTDIEASRKQPLNFSLTREEWQEDLFALDTYIRCFHVHPFLKRDEAGYLELLGQAQTYLTKSRLNTYHINGYFERLVAYTADGHAYIAGKSKRFGSLPYRLGWFGNDLYVVEVNKGDAVLLGAKVLSINNRQLKDVNNQLKPFLPDINSSSFKLQSKDVYHLPGLLYAAGISKNADGVTLNLKARNGKIYRKKYTAEAEQPVLAKLEEAKGVATPYYRLEEEKNQWFAFLEDQKTLYIRYALVVEKNKGDVQNFSAQIDQLFKVKDVHKVIIDLRNNSGGDSYLNASLIEVFIRNKQINQHGKLFVLTNHNTFSAAINFAGNMEIKTKALFVGEKTGDAASFAGEVGPEALYQLPNSKIIVSLSFSEWNTTYDNDIRDAPALDIPVELTIEDFINGKDPVLQAALDYKSHENLQLRMQTSSAKWIGHYDYSPDKALKIFEENNELHMEITELVFSRLNAVNDSEYKTHMSGMKLKRLKNGDIELIQSGCNNRILKKLEENQLKPLELLIAGRFDEAKAAYTQIHKDNPNLLSIRGNSLGILASHIRAKYKNEIFYRQLRDIAESLYGSHIKSWDISE